MKVSVLIYVNGYAQPDNAADLVHCASMKEARAEIAATVHEAQRFGAGYDCDGDGGATALVFRGWIDDATDVYPDWTATVGPRGGVRLSAA